MAVTELRLVVTAEDYEEALRFYRDVLGLPVAASFDSFEGRATLLDCGRARLELFDYAQARHVDAIEVGRRVAGRIRVAFEVDDTPEVTERLVEGGARVLAPPTRTPWGSLNSRVEAPAGLQLTLFCDEPGG